MIEFELETLPSAQLFELCAAHLERGEYWAEFNRRYNQILIRSVYYGYRRFAQAEPPNRWVVKELVQDVYAKLLKDDCLTLRRFRGHTEAEAQVYLSQAAVNVTADHLRHTHALKRYAEMVSIEDLLRERKEDEVVAKADDYTDRLAQEELIELLCRTFTGSTSRRDILIFLLHVLEGLSPEEIAATGHFDLKPTSIAHIITRMKAELRKILLP